MTILIKYAPIINRYKIKIKKMLKHTIISSLLLHLTNCEILLDSENILEDKAAAGENSKVDEIDSAKDDAEKKKVVTG